MGGWSRENCIELWCYILSRAAGESLGRGVVCIQVVCNWSIVQSSGNLSVLFRRNTGALRCLLLDTSKASTYTTNSGFSHLTSLIEMGSKNGDSSEGTNSLEISPSSCIENPELTFPVKSIYQSHMLPITALQRMAHVDRGPEYNPLRPSRKLPSSWFWSSLGFWLPVWSLSEYKNLFQ